MAEDVTTPAVPVVDRDAKPTVVGWLFSKAGQEILPTDRAQYDKLWDEGWRGTPWAFGIETHPSTTPATLATPSALGPMSAGADAKIAALESKVGKVEEALALLQASHEGLLGRLASLETPPMSTFVAPPVPDEEETSSGPRRHR